MQGVLVVRDGAGQQTALELNAAPGAAVASFPLWQLLGFAVLGG